jgi:glucose/arabinose dehydrogenase
MLKFRQRIGPGALGLAVMAILPVTAVAQLGVESVVDGLSQPVRLVSPPGDLRLFVVEQAGLVKVFTHDGVSLGVFLDVTALTDANEEQGLLGIAFPPDYQTRGRFYIHYTNLAGDTRVARYQVTTDPDRANPASAEIILPLDQPYPNHNGGHLEFGPDGMLYIGLGDGGSSGDPQGRAQNPQTLLGKMLRIDVSPTTGYAIPPDNPFVGRAPLDEIWHLGVRNPWTYAFDTATGDLYIADVGQDRVEEVDVQPAGHGGLNFGWDITEGSLCNEPPQGCDTSGLTLPVFEYAHAGSLPSGCSISGGQIYRGTAHPELVGRYFFADYCSNQIWSVVWDGADGVSELRDWSDILRPAAGWGNIASIGRDDDGELYFVDLGAGAIYRLAAADPTPVGGPVAAVATLAGNTPNPFNPRTSIAFGVARDGATVVLRIYDAAGHLVRTLVDGPRPAGDQTVDWDGADDAGKAMPAGVYVCRMSQDGATHARRLTLVK